MYYWVYLYQYIENVIKNVIFIIHLANFTLCFCFLIHQDWVLLWWARRLWLFFSYHIITEPNICLKYYSPKTHKYLFGYFLKQFSFSLFNIQKAIALFLVLLEKNILKEKHVSSFSFYSTTFKQFMLGTSTIFNTSSKHEFFKHRISLICWMSLRYRVAKV